MPGISIKILLLSAVLFGCMSESDQSKRGMVLVEGGDFVMGTSNEEIDSLIEVYGYPRGFIASEYPPHKAVISSFYVDKFEVTNADFKAFIDKYPIWQKENIPDSLHNGDYLKHWQNNTYPDGMGSNPVVYVTWYAAMEYCKCLNKRLPTEAEWEFVARTRGKDYVYPWGNTQPDSTKANYFKHIGHAIDVGSYPPNELGVYDLAGNAWEFTLDGWSTDFYSQSQVNNPVNGFKAYTIEELFGVKTRRVIRGGSWGGAVINLRNTFRDSHPPQGAGDHVGFRCVMDEDVIKSK